MIMTPREKRIMRLREKLERLTSLLTDKYSDATLEDFNRTEKELQIQEAYLAHHDN